MFRIMMFQYRQDEGLKITILADLVSNLFYPFDNSVYKEHFRMDIMKAFNDFSNKNNEITEENFVKIMDNIDRFMKLEHYERFLYKIFKRHDKDKDNKLSREGKTFFEWKSFEFEFAPCLFNRRASKGLEFINFLKNFKEAMLTEKDLEDIYERFAMDSQVKSGVDFHSFKKNSMRLNIAS